MRFADYERGILLNWLASSNRLAHDGSCRRVSHAFLRIETWAISTMCNLSLAVGSRRRTGSPLPREFRLNPARTPRRWPANGRPCMLPCHPLKRFSGSTIELAFLDWSSRLSACSMATLVLCWNPFASASRLFSTASRPILLAIRLKALLWFSLGDRWLKGDSTFSTLASGLAPHNATRFPFLGVANAKHDMLGARPVAGPPNSTT